MIQEAGATGHGDKTPPGIRLCMVTTSYPRWEGDYSGWWISEMASHLVKRGHSVTVVAPHQPGARTRELLGGVDVRRFRYAPSALENEYGNWYAHEQPGWRRKLSLLGKRLFLPAFLLAGMSTVGRLSVANSTQTVLAHWAVPSGLIAVMAGKLLRRKVVLYVYGGDVVVLPRSLPLRLLVQWVLKHADRVLCNSYETRRDAAALGVPEAKMSVLYHGIDRSRFRCTVDGAPIRERLGVAPDQAMILSVGRMVWYKGFDYLAEAARQALAINPGLRFVVGGTGPLEAHYRQTVERLGLTERVRFVGSVPDTELPLYYAASDVYVSSSVVDPAGNREGLGVTIIEAMASGKPVIVTDAGAPKEFVQDGENGLVVPEKDPQALAAAIVRLAGDAELRARLTQRGLKTVEELFDWSAITARLEEVLVGG